MLNKWYSAIDFSRLKSLQIEDPSSPDRLRLLVGLAQNQQFSGLRRVSFGKTPVNGSMAPHPRSTMAQYGQNVGEEHDEASNTSTMVRHLLPIFGSNQMNGTLFAIKTDAGNHQRSVTIHSTKGAHAKYYNNAGMNFSTSYDYGHMQSEWKRLWPGHDAWMHNSTSFPLQGTRPVHNVEHERSED